VRDYALDRSNSSYGTMVSSVGPSPFAAPHSITSSASASTFRQCEATRPCMSASPPNADVRELASICPL